MLGQVCWPLLPDELRGSLSAAAYDAVRGERPARIEAHCAALDRWLETRLYPAADG